MRVARSARPPSHFELSVSSTGGHSLHDATWRLSRRTYCARGALVPRKARPTLAPTPRSARSDTKRKRAVKCKCTRTLTSARNIRSSPRSPVCQVNAGREGRGLSSQGSPAHCQQSQQGGTLRWGWTHGVDPWGGPGRPRPGGAESRRMPRTGRREEGSHPSPRLQLDSQGRTVFTRFPSLRSI